MNGLLKLLHEAHNGDVAGIVEKRSSDDGNSAPGKERKLKHQYNANPIISQGYIAKTPKPLDEELSNSESGNSKDYKPIHRD